MKSQKFFFSIVAVLVIVGVFLFFFFGVVKPRFQSEVRGVNAVQTVVAKSVGLVSMVDTVAVAHVHDRLVPDVQRVAVV